MIYLDSEDFHYLDVNNKNNDNYELSKEPLKASKRDLGGIAAIVYSFTIIGIVTAYTIYTAWQIAFG